MPIDKDRKQTYIVTDENPIHYRMLSRYVSRTCHKCGHFEP